VNRELAEHISLLAAPIFAALVQTHVVYHAEVSVETQAELRRHAITQAHALWLETLDIEVAT
jgi:hypothetical protein